jgi:hypothetical protein
MLSVIIIIITVIICYRVFSLLSGSRFDAFAKRRSLTAALFCACVLAAEAAEKAKEAELDLDYQIWILGEEKDSLHEDFEAALADSHAQLQEITSRSTAQ